MVMVQERPKSQHFFVSVFILHPAWEDEGWREQPAGDSLEEVEVSRPTSLDKGQAGKAVRSM